MENKIAPSHEKINVAALNRGTVENNIAEAASEQELIEESARQGGSSPASPNEIVV